MTWMAAVAIATLLGRESPAPLLVRDRDPVCREVSVVEEMTRQIKAAEYYSQVDPRLVTEQPTADPHVVRCGVCVELAPYNTLRFGDQPIRQCRMHMFEVEIYPAGFLVRDAG